MALRSQGGLELAPAFTNLVTTPSAYVWAIATARNGDLYAATGTPAKVYRITPKGQSQVIFQSQELQVQALVVNAQGDIYAATNPDGKIYRIEPPKKQLKNSEPDTQAAWTSSVYFDPGTKYVWSLALDSTGNLYAATGDHGELFRITPQGGHSVFFKSDEAHIRVLAFDRKGDLVAGTDGSGLIYRISPNGDGFVLYSAPKKEITALAIDDDGNIYAAGTGEKRGNASNLPATSSSAAGVGSSNSQSGVTGATLSSPASQILSSLPNSGANSAGGSEIYRIARDGSPSRIWGSRDDLVYALAFDSNGKLIAGTGNRGRIFRLDGNNQFTDLVTASATQVTAFAPGPRGGLYAAASNLGKIFFLDSASEGTGTYTSDVFDAHIFSRWGRAEFRGNGNIALFARSGNVDNPDRNWSPWQKIDLQKDAGIPAPSARFVQWKAVFHSGAQVPHLDSVTLNYLSKNVAPEFEEVTVMPGTRFTATSKSNDNDGSISTSNNASSFENSPSANS